MSDRRLQVFHAVATHLSFTKAAESLHMTQPAVTFQVRQLEEQLNARLFDRISHRIVLTDVGQVVYDHAKQITALYQQMENAVKITMGEIGGTLVLGASTTIAEYMLPALLGDFCKEFTDIKTHLRVSNTEGIVDMVEANEIDFGIVEAPVHNKNLVVEICRQDQLVCITPNTYSLDDKKTLTIQEIMKYPYIYREEGSGTREVIGEYLSQHGFAENQLRLSMELGSPESVKSAVEAGMGIAIVSRVTVSKELQLGTLKAINLDPPLTRPFSFVYKKQKFRVQAVEVLLEFAQQYCASIYKSK